MSLIWKVHRKHGMRQRGSGMIEVMVALSILAIGLLGMAQLQNAALRSNQSAYYYSQAIFLADDLVERMRSNPTFVDSYLVQIGNTMSGTSATLCEAASCTGANLAFWDLRKWKDSLAESLPSGDGEVTKVGDTFVIVTQFDDSKGRGSTDAETARFVLEVEF